MAFLKEVEEGSFKGKVQSVCMCEWGGFFFPEGKGKVPCDGSLWVPRMIYKKKKLKKNSTPLTMLPSFSPSLRTRAGGEEIID